MGMVHHVHFRHHVKVDNMDVNLLSDGWRRQRVSDYIVLRPRTTIYIQKPVNIKRT